MPPHARNEHCIAGAEFRDLRDPLSGVAVGDMHVSMGDGEICFTGVEIALQLTEQPLGRPDPSAQSALYQKGSQP